VKRRKEIVWRNIVAKGGGIKLPCGARVGGREEGKKKFDKRGGGRGWGRRVDSVVGA